MAMFQNSLDAWKTLSDIFLTKSLRERLLVLCSALIVIYLSWMFFIGSPMNEKKAQIIEKTRLIKVELDKISAEEKVYVNLVENDPSVAKKRELVRLDNQLQSLNKDLQSLSVGLLPARNIPQVVHDVLDKSTGLTLVDMTKNAAEELLLREMATTTYGDSSTADFQSEDDTVLAPEESEQSSIGVYKHSVSLGVEGSYFEIRDFLKRLESLPWKFYWNYLTYKVASYPTAEVTIEIYTLSTERGFLGG